jgi:transcriptional regulator with XRE-family HTH domain
VRDLISKNLAKYRESRGWSQNMLAAKASVQQSTISEIEADKRKNPGIRIIGKLAAALGISITDLLEEKSA